MGIFKVFLKWNMIVFWLLSAQILVFAQERSDSIRYFIDAGEKSYKKNDSRALEFADRAISLAKKEGDQLSEIQGDFLKVKVYSEDQQIDKAFVILYKTKKAAENLEHMPSILEANYLLAYLYFKNNEYDKAIEQDRKTIEMSGDVDSLRLWRARAEFNMGYCLNLTSQFDSSMAAYIRALRIFESILDTSGIITVYQQIGNLYLLSKNLDDAMNIFQLNSQLIEDHGDSIDRATNEKNIGVVYQKRGESGKARAYYRRSLEFSQGQGQYIGDAITYGNIGSSLMDEGRVSEGLEGMQKALELKQKYGATPNSLTHTLFDLSKAYRLLGNNEQARKYAEEVIAIGKANNNALAVQYGYKYLSEVNDADGDYQKAYDNFRTYTQVKDSIFNEERSKQIKELEISYESEKKDKAIISLEKDRTVQRARRQLFSMISLSMILIIGVFYNRQRLKARKNKELLLKGQEVDRLKSDFFANVSHEFRTPLTLILGPIQSKLEGALDSKEREELLMMQRNAVRLQRLINDILDLSKFDAGKLELQTSSVNITELIKGLVGTFSSLAESKEIILRVEIEEDILGIVDKHKLETILINLLSNAFKYTPDSGSITVSAGGSNGSLKIKVKDSGPGIPEEKRAKIFDRFYQVDDAEARKNKGTGIGLAFTQELVKMHGGNLILSSKVGEGCTFSFSISYYPENYLGEFDETEHAIPENSDASIKEILNESVLSDLPLILIVEDNADVRNYIHSILTDTCQVVFAMNGLEGRDKAFDIIPDLIISDVMMPIMDGFEFCAAVKSDIRTAHIPVILLTAKSSSENRIKGLEQEADIFMSKPFNPLELELQVKNLLNLKERMRDRYLQDNLQTIPESVVNNSLEQKFLFKLEEVMEYNYENPDFTAEMMSDAMGMSRSQLHRKLKALTGDSTTEYIRSYRLKIAYQKLLVKTGSISEIAFQVGFNNASYFNKCFKRSFGMQPSEIDV